jgi:hypothetical protein
VKNAIIHPNTKRPGFAVARYADSKIGEAGYSVYRSVSRRYTAEKALLYVIFRRIIKPIRKRAAASHPLLFRWQLGSSIIQSRQVR